MIIKKKIEKTKYVLRAPNISEWRDFEDEFTELVNQPTVEIWMTVTKLFMESISDKLKKSEPLSMDEKTQIKKYDEEARAYNTNLLKLVIKKPRDFDVDKITKRTEAELLGLSINLVSGLSDAKKKD